MIYWLTTLVLLSICLVPLLEVKIEKESRAVSANKPQQVTCRAVGSSPPPRISWWKAGARLQASHETVKESYVHILLSWCNRSYKQQSRTPSTFLLQKCPTSARLHSWILDFHHSLLPSQHKDKHKKKGEVGKKKKKQHIWAKICIPGSRESDCKKGSNRKRMHWLERGEEMPSIPNVLRYSESTTKKNRGQQIDHFYFIYFYFFRLILRFPYNARSAGKLFYLDYSPPPLSS